MTLPELLAQWERERHLGCRGVYPDGSPSDDYLEVGPEDAADLMRRVVEACIADVQTMYDAEPAGLDGSACNALLRALARLEALKEA